MFVLVFVCLIAATDSPISKPTPLYGQPSWWGEDEDPANKKQSRGGKSPESLGLRMCLVLLLVCIQATDSMVFISLHYNCFISPHIPEIDPNL